MVIIDTVVIDMVIIGMAIIDMVIIDVAIIEGIKYVCHNRISTAFRRTINKLIIHCVIVCVSFFI